MIALPVAVCLASPLTILPGNTDHGGVGRHGSDEHRARADPAVAADGHRPEHRGAAEDRHRILDRRVALDALASKCRRA